ncbi:MAG TPA: biotin/lipoyl-binding protein, partial [Hyphomicrobiaceae bacterium]|nr:biotin/lipoyl-binding protein [Hyphomicrobiaceae bacterium]
MSTPAVAAEGGLSARLWAAAAVVLLLLGGTGTWIAATSLAGAVVTSGFVVVDGNVKKVQHPTGGVVGAIEVTEGQHVEAGDLLVRLDETVIRNILRRAEFL